MRKILCSLVAAFTFASFASAQMPGLDPAPAPKTTPAKVAAKQLTVEELGTMLENLGYEVVPVKTDKGTAYGWDNKFDSDGTTIYARVEISPSGKFLWITGLIATVKNANDIPKETLIALLAANTQIAPCQVQLDTKCNSISVALALGNSNFTPADMRYALQRYTTSIKTVVKIWSDSTKATETGSDPLVP